MNEDELTRPVSPAVLICDCSSASYILGVLRACEFLSKKFDQPTMAANIIRDELVISGFCSLKYAKQLAKGEDVNLTKVWRESCLRGLP